MQIQPYLFFEGRCEEAIEFYRRTLGADVKMLLRWKDCPEPPKDKSMIPPSSENKVMHARLRIGSTELMASDGQCKGKPSFQGFAPSLNAANEAEADRWFSALADGGQVHMPLGRLSSRRASEWSRIASVCPGWLA